MRKLVKGMLAFTMLLAVILGITNISLIDAKRNSAVKDKKIVIGFSQIGTESEWRIAETNSVINAAKKAGIILKFRDGKQRQENQITDIRKFIKEKVDVIALAPVVELGWNTVLMEARNAKIPVILMDRTIKGPKSLYTTCIGPNFVLEGKNACKQLAKFMHRKGDIVEILGTIGSAAELDRKNGFRKQLLKYPNMKIIKSAPGDFTRATGKRIMKSLLSVYGKKVQGLFAHNDDMAIGAIQAIEEYGLKPGKDIKIVSVDGIRDIFKAMIAGNANCTVECNPLLGPELMKASKALVSGKKIPKWIKPKEGVYTQNVAKKLIAKRKY
jgi:simple sugar transport system substrate-binding protein